MHSALKHDGKRALRVRPRRHRGRARAAPRDDPRASTSSTGRLTTLDDRRRAAARAPTSARWPRTSARRSAAARTWRRCAAPAAAPLDVARRRHARRAGSADEAERDALLLPADALLADWPRVRLDDDEAGRFLTGLRRRAAAAPTRRACASTAPSRSAFLGSAHVAGRRADRRPPARAPSKSQASIAARRPSESNLMTTPDPQHRHHRPRRPRQDHAGRPAAAPERHLPREREGRRARDGHQRPRARARHHDPGQELRRRVAGHAHQHRRHAGPRRLRRRGRARAVDGRRRAAAGRRGRRADAADALRHPQGAGARA